MCSWSYQHFHTNQNLLLGPKITHATNNRWMLTVQNWDICTWNQWTLFYSREVRIVSSCLAHTQKLKNRTFKRKKKNQTPFEIWMLIAWFPYLLFSFAAQFNDFVALRKKTCFPRTIKGLRRLHLIRRLNLLKVSLDVCQILFSETYCNI